MISSSKQTDQTGQSVKVGPDCSAVRPSGQRRQHSQLLNQGESPQHVLKQSGPHQQVQGCRPSWMPS